MSFADVSLELLPTPVTILTEEQKKMVSFVYDSGKQFADGILNHPSMAAAMKVTQLVASIVKLIESLQFQGKPLSGPNKKAVALELGRQLIQDVIKDQAVKDVVIPIYNMTAESTLETLIDVSQHLNVAAKEAAASCCEAIAACIKK